VPDGADLENHHADGVRDDVVELTRDPRALFCHRDARSRLSVALVAAPDDRNFATLLESDAGKAFLDEAVGWYALILVMFLFNTVLGEELLFRGYLLPRMNGAFGRGDWVANGILFAGYHLHVPWAIPGTLLEMFTTAYPTKRYRSAWIGIAVHSAQSVFLGILILTLVV
jgi:membrane protease YdiL (CAAX protease family)